MKKQNSKINRNGSALKISLVALLCSCLAGIPACSGQEASRENFNNNSTGADQDNTEVRKNDTLMIDNTEIKDKTDSL
ncbi:hypothetical protein Q0590_15035 [Rhodocytophaga aerolata]|uniref:Uncharacterized protein n=1 Tax=Rhodocytophaga aerolata TaxID=455078 RepID=A0ABT8R9Z3_9BACT|nr:hypothetical protein [Rhodocytophaga aerolata]MDO1447582.1 hypothetical protein [Rhodocytophaga aerolata]